MRRCQNCLAPWRYVCTVTVTCSLDLFSTRTSTRDDRCFVLKEGDFWICLQKFDLYVCDSIDICVSSIYMYAARFIFVRFDLFFAVLTLNE